MEPTNSGIVLNLAVCHQAHICSWNYITWCLHYLPSRQNCSNTLLFHCQIQRYTTEESHRTAANRLIYRLLQPNPRLLQPDSGLLPVWSDLYCSERDFPSLLPYVNNFNLVLYYSHSKALLELFSSTHEKTNPEDIKLDKTYQLCLASW